MKAVVDDKIPYIREALKEIFDTVAYMPGAAISAADVRDADVLIVRTRTKCNETLLAGSRVRFIATATIGYDHLDTRYLQQAGIGWSNCPGCNATSVAQYIHSCLLLLQRERDLDLNRTCLGLVGVGHVGTAVKAAAESLGVRVLLNDPPRKEAERNGTTPVSGLEFVPLERLKAECDIISFHTPLVRNGIWPTEYLADRQFLYSLTKRPVIINTSRGEVVDNQALLDALNDGRVSDAIIDTWEHEPHILLPLLQRAYIGTAHIAGYSADGKANATRMVLSAVCKFLHLPAHFDITPPPLPNDFRPSARLDELALQLYNPQNDCMRLRTHPELFEELRGNYPLRREHI